MKIATITKPMRAEAPVKAEAVMMRTRISCISRNIISAQGADPPL